MDQYYNYCCFDKYLHNYLQHYKVLTYYKEEVPYWTNITMTMYIAIDSLSQPFHYNH